VTTRLSPSPLLAAAVAAIQGGKPDILAFAQVNGSPSKLIMVE
jgi:hypothetical protein